MPTTRPTLKLDEQSFQGLLAAAFTIQEHNDKVRRGSAPPSPPDSAPKINKIFEKFCPQCATPLKPNETYCHECGSNEFRPGERMQRKFASLWEMSQEQGVRHDPFPVEPLPDDKPESVLDLASAAPALAPAVAKRDRANIVDAQEEVLFQEREWPDESVELADPEQSPLALEQGESTSEAVAADPLGRLKQYWRTLNAPRADLYLGIAILLAVFAVLWPAPDSPQKPSLRPWQRMLVKLGIAEAPPLAVHYRGDPNVQVWVDPHTALYYCPGEERFGKTTDGRLAAQREAQLDQFEPANRSVCQ